MTFAYSSGFAAWRLFYVLHLVVVYVCCVCFCCLFCSLLNVFVVLSLLYFHIEADSFDDSDFSDARCNIPNRGSRTWRKKWRNFTRSFKKSDDGSPLDSIV